MPTAFCCFYETYPPITGAASVSWNLVKFSAGSRLLVQCGDRSSRREMPGGLTVVTVGGRRENRIAKLAMLRKRVAEIANEVRRAGSEVVILEGASWALYHLLLLRRLRRELPEARIIYHSHNVEYLLRRNRNGRAIAALTRWAERRLLRGADLSTAVSAADQAHFARLYGLTPILLPNGVDAERFGAVASDAVERMRSVYALDARTLLFSGFYAYPPNREAVDFLARSVMPAVRERYPSATLALTGGGAPYREPWIRNVGSIPHEDFAAFVAACGVAVAPIFSGSGTRLKILEAMAAGVPVVATEKAAEGLGLRDREHALFAHSPREFASAVGELFENPELAAGLVRAARQKVNAEFSWRTIVSDFEKTVNAALGAPAHPRYGAALSRAVK